ncbi:2-phospho-L-lactate guanylyltransferase [Microbacterium sp. SORGH_AS_0888]|uniref:2-phospho-L-lactate guanylyltransferase n=1 Tax=Microbacterium sp. SORGH_AS_0888 TaxID=3041791 RepID=UPI002787E03F|nr:2-phospho-L-lactate guanylyltransferase [Microbacterium sp. SORGH_AS_0888]MDQ1129546.1 2-phospho-L-lactate guanylyltransferase [Microbacterium sp. SORGH_AS_0888]
MSWTVVVPLKPAARGKSRLTGASVELVRAIGLDTVTAAVGAASVVRVVVVTSDAATAAAVADDARVTVAPDPGAGLNAAIAAGVAVAGAGPVAALLGDVPALVPAELDLALGLAARHPRSVVPDAEGTGSTLVTAAGVPWESAFGPDSFARHLALGCVPLAVDAASGLRRDVDTLAQLRAVLDRAGPLTRAAWTAGA